MCPLNKTKKKHIFLAKKKKNCVYANKKVTHFLEKNLCTVDKKKRATEQFLFSKKT